MTSAQRDTVNQMVADGFHVVLAAKDIVRLSRVQMPALSWLTAARSGRTTQTAHRRALC
ncbi:hypothetical protein [Pseudomonas syringae]|uniref:Uncharacterized protein n=1 Tax=Pseudomonas syringae CC1417 TaxID=1357272 RepID=A0AAU8LE02_PSESX